jgi:hypothetical protein
VIIRIQDVGSLTSAVLENGIAVTHVQQIQPRRLAVKGSRGLLADDLGARAVDFADEREVRREHEAPFRTRADALAVRDQGLGASGVATDEIDSQLGTVASKGLGKGPHHVGADACRSAREGRNQRQAVRKLGDGGADDAETRHRDWPARDAADNGNARRKIVLSYTYGGDRYDILLGLKMY